MKQILKHYWEKTKKRTKRFLCAISVGHRFEEEVFNNGRIQILKCEECGCYANINHQLDEAFISTENTLQQDLELMQRLVEGLYRGN